MPKLTPHFTLEELTDSDTARAHGIANTPTAEHRANLVVTALGMEQVRSILGGVAIEVTSGYRNPQVNALAGGVPNSDHALGFACDFRRAGMSAFDAATKLADSTLVYDQLILETSRRIVHVSFNPRLRMQRLTQKGGAGTPFLPGIVP